ncbi:MAG: phage major capsid protein [Pseudohongiellaceae bacterium]|nr:phage major capsid protein [Pseudohongiellaceae bacterium]
MTREDIVKQRERMAEIAANARAELDKITDNTSEAEAKEIEARFDTMMADHDKINARIEREEKIADAQKRASENRNPEYPDGEDRGIDEDKLPEYREVFAKVICGQQDDLSSEERQVLRDGMTEFRAQTAGTTTAGGFTVPTTLADEIIRSMQAWGPMYDKDVATVFQTTSGNPMKIPTVNDTAVTAEAHTEAAPLTDDGGKDATFGQKSLDAYAFDTEFLRWSWELDMDSIFSMEQLLAALLGERLGRIANSQLTTGTGSSAPNGIVTASSLGKTAAGTAAITFDEILDLEHSVDPAYRQSPKCRYMFNDSTLLAIRKLKDGNGNYLWQQGDVKSGAPATFNGRPYSINQAMDSLAAAKKVITFGDFSKYYVRKVGSPVIGVLKERFWPDIGIAGLIRFDGELGDTAAVKHLITAAS